MFLKSPLSYRRISSTFTYARRHPILKTVRPHLGIDYAAPSGTPVSALGSGTITFVGRKGGFGNYVEVRHDGTYKTGYGHLSRFAEGLKRGKKVEQGDVIAYVGSTGPHPVHTWTSDSTGMASQ
jgi:murein DD-endopeptidase MepM/ murein hydrolase activator NlpD